MRQLAQTFALLLLVAGAARADVKPHALFSDGCVLQQGMSVPVWGTANDGEKVTVEFREQKLTTTASGGKWMVKLKPLAAGGPFELKISGANTVTIKNVLVGEVWVASGQSNMAWQLVQSAEGEAEIPNAKYPLIRLFTVPRNPQDQPQTTINASWKECTPETVRQFSAVAYFFGRALHKARNVPIGLINTSVGGTPSEAWTSRATIDGDPNFKDILDRYAKAVSDYPAAKTKYEAELEKHKLAVAEAKRTNQPAPRAPQIPYGPEHQSRPAGLFNGMVAPLIPYAFRGALWYQGESNRTRAYEYRAIFPALIRDWRKAWGQGDFPFLFVQLAPFMKIEAEPKDSELAELREAQLLTTRRVPKTALAVITDVGDENDVHPRQKLPVGERLALAARALVYGEKIEYSGPVYASMKVDGNRAILSFTHVGGGLVVKGDKLMGFALAGADHKFYWAEAVIEGDTVVVSSPQVTSPVAVRYGWANTPVLNLWNKAGLPATPFRTDDFPMLTRPVKATAQRN